MPTPLFSLLFVNYQSATLLKRAIASWEGALENVSHEIIVINNDPKEASAVNALAEGDKVIVKNLSENVGFGAANNRAAAMAKGQWLFLLNPDTEYEGGSIEGLIPVLESYPESLGGVCLIDGDGKGEVWSGGKFPTLWQLVRHRLFGTPLRPLWNEPTFTETDWVSGAALIVSRSSFEKLGGFDEDFFLYFEDVDLAKRAKQSGMSVWRSPALTVRHQGGASHNEHSKQKQVYYKSEYRYFFKHRSLLEARCFWWLQKIFFS